MLVLRYKLKTLDITLTSFSACSLERKTFADSMCIIFMDKLRAIFKAEISSQNFLWRMLKHVDFRRILATTSLLGVTMIQQVLTRTSTERVLKRKNERATYVLDQKHDTYKELEISAEKIWCLNNKSRTLFIQPF